MIYFKRGLLKVGLWKYSIIKLGSLPLLGICVTICAGCARIPNTGVATACEWSARKPIVRNDKIIGWEKAPGFLRWKQAEPKQDGFSGEILEARLSGPFAKGAWSQHAGILLTIPKEISAQKTFTVSFKARRVSGAKYLTVLRSWGGAKPWNAIPLSGKWKKYQINLTSRKYATDTIVFSLVKTANGLQQYAAGSFQLADVNVKCTRK